jgi:hypothetical protein
MDLTWFIGHAQCGAGRSEHQDDSETGCRGANAQGAAPHPSSP